MNVCEQFLDARVAQGHGDTPAVRTDDRTYTYAEVARLSVHYAALLADDGVTPGRRVIVAMPDGVDLVAAFFGVLRVGGVVVLANPEAPAGRVRALVEDTAAAAAFVPASRAEECRSAARAAAEGGVRVYAAGDAVVAARLTSGPTEKAAWPAAPEDDAVWQLTSGSTGQAKAVRHAHRAFGVSAAAYGAGVLGLHADDVTVAAPKLFFGYATGSNLLFPFAAGASCLLFAERSTADALLERIRRHRPTVLVTTPAMVRQMVAHPSASRDDLRSLRLATSAGEALPPGLHDRWDARFGVELLDGFGMTEMCHVVIGHRPGATDADVAADLVTDVVTGVVTGLAPAHSVPRRARPDDRGDDLVERRGTLGRPLAGYDVRLCDADGREVVDGEPGELWVRGASRALGYWQRPDDEARVFRGEWCVAGDMLRREPDGTFTFCGRVDDMLKVNGRWVAPVAVEQCVLDHPRVRDVAVVGVRDADGLVRPCAFVVAEGHDARLADEIQALALARLERHACPRSVVFIEALPRNAQGKVDRRALVALAAARSPTADEPSADD